MVNNKISNEYYFYVEKKQTLLDTIKKCKKLLIRYDAHIKWENGEYDFISGGEGRQICNYNPMNSSQAYGLTSWSGDTLFFNYNNSTAGYNQNIILVFDENGRVIYGKFNENGILDESYYIMEFKNLLISEQYPNSKYLWDYFGKNIDMTNFVTTVKGKTVWTGVFEHHDHKHSSIYIELKKWY